MPETLAPAYYTALGRGWRRDAWAILHPPYTAWHLSYVVIGASLAPKVSGYRLLATLIAFFLAVGIAAHALDELNGRPLRTAIPAWILKGAALVGLAGAVGFGLAGLPIVGIGLLPFIALGVLFVFAYNLELLGGRMHGDFWFALSWGAFPLLTAYLAYIPADRVGVVIDVPDREVLPAGQLEVAAAQAHDDRAVDRRRPHDRAAEDQPDVLEHRVAAVLRRLDDAGVAAGPERDRERTGDTGGLQGRDRPSDGARIVVVVVADDHR